MSADKSILQRLEGEGQKVPRVRLPGSEASAPGEQRYEIVGEIARGGVGVVYKGRDNDLGRDVAMKMLREEHLKSPELVQRFVEEAQIGGQLQHPGIVPVYELGVQEGKRPFFSMKLVKGRTLAELLQARTSPSDGRHALLAHYAQACLTVAYAHSRGVIHRDLKPANVMVGAFGEVQVVDWGFAKVLKRGGIDDERRARREVTIVATVRSAAEGSASIAGSVMGTPAYMPPEQALGHVDDLTERADVFSLGAILCEILTGKPPYLDDVLVAAAQARLGDAFARLDDCGGDTELVALAKACLSPLPKDRPRSAREVADALGAHLSGAERRAHEARVRAAQEQANVDEQRRARRQTLLIASSVLLVVLGGGGGLLAKTSVDAERERERTAGFEAAVREATRLQASGEWPGARSAAERSLGLAGSDPARRREAEALHAGVEAAAVAAARVAEKTRREAELLARLDEIALRRGDRMDARRTDDDYAAALPDFAQFADFGRGVELAAHLDQWAWLRRTKLADRDWRPLDALARTLDPDDWRNPLREAGAAGDMVALRALAANSATATQSARSLDLLCSILWEGGEREAAVELLLRAAERYPDDFWIRSHCGHFAGAFDDREGRFTRPQAAIEQLTAAVALRPTSAGAHDSLALAFWSKGDLGAAVDVWRAAVRLDGGNAQAHHNLGVGLRDSGDLDGALAAFRESLRLDPRAPRTYGNLGDALERKGDRDGALATYREAIRVDPNHAAGHNSVGTLLARAGDLDGALAAFREAVRLDPTWAVGHCNLGIVLHAKGDLDGAIACYREATRCDPKYALTYANLALSLWRKGDLDGVVAAYREAIRLGTSDANVPYNLGNMLAQKGDLAGAIASYKEAIRLDPNLATAHTNLGNALRAQGDLDGALACYREALRADPNLALAHLNFGNALGLKGDLDGSAAALREAVRLDPSALMHYAVGNLLLERGDAPRAILSFREAVRLDPNFGEAHTHLGNGLRRCGDVEGAIASYREAIRVKPDLAPAYANLADTLHGGGDVAGALEAYRSAAALVPPGHEFRKWLAETEQEFAAARARLDKMLRGEHRPGSAGEWRTLAGVASLAGNHAAAARCWREAFASDPRLAGDPRAGNLYDAARAAVLAGPEWRGQALSWLRAALEAWSDQPPGQASAAARVLRQWKTDPDLAPVRDGADTPADWRKLWADVDALLARASESAR